jgi:hypothetical protein
MDLQAPDTLGAHVLVLGAPCVLIVAACVLLLYAFWGANA